MNSRQLLSVLAVFLLMTGGCSTPPLQHAPLCPEPMVHLEPVSVEDQRLLHDTAPDVLEKLALNAARRASHIDYMTALIRDHDEQLGGCSLE
jgi:hypothetical protein